MNAVQSVTSCLLLLRSSNQNHVACFVQQSHITPCNAGAPNEDERPIPGIPVRGRTEAAWRSRKYLERAAVWWVPPPLAATWMAPARTICSMQHGSYGLKHRASGIQHDGHIAGSILHVAPIHSAVRDSE